MNKQTKALKMAIEVLSQNEGWFEPEAAIQACKEALEGISKTETTTKDEALKMAVEALQNIDNWLPTIGQRGLRDYEADALQACKEALEHKTRIWECEGYDSLCQQLEIAEKKIEKLKAKQPAQEPWGWYENHDIYDEKQSNDSIALYTHPAPSWQGLSEDEMMEIWCSDEVESTLDFGCAIEAELKRKNNG